MRRSLLLLINIGLVLPACGDGDGALFDSESDLSDTSDQSDQSDMSDVGELKGRSTLQRRNFDCDSDCDDEATSWILSIRRGFNTLRLMET